MVCPHKGPALDGALALAAIGVGGESKATFGLWLCESTQAPESPSKLLGSWTSFGLIGSRVF